MSRLIEVWVNNRPVSMEDVREIVNPNIFDWRIGKARDADAAFKRIVNQMKRRVRTRREVSQEPIIRKVPVYRTDSMEPLYFRYRRGCDE